MWERVCYPFSLFRRRVYGDAVVASCTAVAGGTGGANDYGERVHTHSHFGAILESFRDIATRQLGRNMPRLGTA